MQSGQQLNIKIYYIIYIFLLTLKIILRFILYIQYVTFLLHMQDNCISMPLSQWLLRIYIVSDIPLNSTSFIDIKVYNYFCEHVHKVGSILFQTNFIITQLAMFYLLLCFNDHVLLGRQGNVRQTSNPNQP